MVSGLTLSERQLALVILGLLAMCGLCAVMNAAQYAVTRTVRTAGILICLAWAVQEAWWWQAGHDSLALFVVCDGAIIAWFLTRRRRFDTGERLIAATIPLTTALGVYAEAHGGHTTESWWINFYLVAGQMLVGMPFAKRATLRSFLERWKANFQHRGEWTNLEHRGTNG